MTEEPRDSIILVDDFLNIVEVADDTYHVRCHIDAQINARGAIQLRNAFRRMISNVLPKHDDVVS